MKLSAFNISDIEVIAPNFKYRLSGVTSTIIHLVPLQYKMGIKIAALGVGLPASVPQIRFRDLWKLWQRPRSKSHRVWHARRNIEMLAGIILRDVLRMPLKLAFTSASQRTHTAYTRWLIGRMDGVIATSSKSAHYLRVPHKVIMHGVDTEKFKPAVDKETVKKHCKMPQDHSIIGCFGRVRPQKGTDIFVDVMTKLLPQNPNWIAIILGRTTREHLEFELTLQNKIKSAGLETRVLFLGEQSNIAEWYQTLDLYVAPQRWEGFGLTPLEAMAGGVPVVAADVGAFRDLIVEDKTGHVVDIEDHEQFERTIERLMRNHELRANFSAAARAHVTAHFSLESEAHALSQIYSKIHLF